MYISEMRKTTNVVQVGEFSFDASTGELSGNGSTERLRPQAARVLSLLIDQAGMMVSREDLHAGVWPNTTHVEYDASLNVCITQIRAVLGDEADSPTYIETLPRRGYRLLADVSQPDQPQTPKTRRSRFWTGATTIALAGAIATIILVANGTGPDTISMAVMPFRSIPSSDSLAFLEDGLTEELITALAGVNSDRLTVIARTSSFRLAQEGLDAVDVGNELEVDYVLLGALRQVPAGYRVTARLLETASGAYVWTDSYDLTPDEVLHTERYVAEHLTIALSERFDTSFETALAWSPTPHPRSREAVLRARYLLSHVTREDASQAANILLEVLRVDSTYVDLFVDLARAWLQLGEFAAADEALERARAIDRTSARIDDVAGQIALYGRADAVTAARLFARSIAKRPGAADVRRTYANALVASGRAGEAAVQGAQALALDPISSVVRGDIGWVFYYAGQYNEARRVCRSMLELVPTSANAQECLLLSAAMEGRLGEETSVVRGVLVNLGATSEDIETLTQAINIGSTDMLWHWLLDDPSRRRQLGPITEARMLALLSDHDGAADAVVEAARLGASAVLYVAADPLLRTAAARPNAQRALEEAFGGEDLDQFGRGPLR